MGEAEEVYGLDLDSRGAIVLSRALTFFILGEEREAKRGG